MILELFVPEIFNGKRLLAKRIVGLSIEKSLIRMVELYATSSKTSITSLQEEAIKPATTPEEQGLNLQQALQTLFAKVSKHDYIRITLPTSIVIFKEVKIPLKDRDKIRMVIDYEVEPMLPFPLQEAVIDFIITHQHPEEDFSQLLVAIVRKQDLTAALEPYNQAGIFPTHVTVDLFALYNSYNHIDEYAVLKEGSALIDVGATSTRIAFLQAGELRLTRNIPKGIETIALLIGEETKAPLETIYTHLSTKGIKTAAPDSMEKVIQKHMINFLNDIQFTLNSFSLKLNFYKDIEKILFIGVDSFFKDFAPFASDVLQTPCEIFDMQKIFSHKKIVPKLKTPPPSWNPFTLALSSALPAPFNHDLDFLRTTLKPHEGRLITYQIATSCGLVLTLFCALITNGFLNIHLLNSHATKIEKKEVHTLRQLLLDGKKNTHDETLARLIDRALKDNKLASLLKKTKSIVEEEKQGWVNLVRLKIHTLPLLAELTSLIDRSTFNITVYSLTIVNDESGLEKIELVGNLKSKIEGEDFQDFAKFEQKLAEKDETKKLTLLSYDDGLDEEEGGVKFTLVFKPKESL